MEFNWSIVGWIAGLVFVYVFGLFEGRGQGYKRRKAEEEQEKKEQPPPPAPKPETLTVDDPGLLRIRDENGSFVLDLDGKRVNPISLSSEQRRRLIDMLNIMRPWLEGRSAPSPSPRPAIPSPSAPPSTVEDRLSTFGGGPPESKPAPPKPAAPASSIVGQIDSILQARLAGTPLEGRGIFLAQSPEGGVIVYIGLTRYNGLDEVPDPEIKAAIRAAISEWENKYTPGL